MGVGSTGAGVTADESHDHDRTTVIKKESEPREHTTIIKKEHEEPGKKVIMYEHDHQDRFAPSD